MQHSDGPYKELQAARAGIEAMRAATLLAEFEEHWKEFLHRTERIWSKSAAHFGKSPKWNGWKGKFEGARKSDELLSYLINARGAEEHTLNEITVRTPGSIGINPAEGTSLHIKSMSLDKGVLSIDSPDKLKITVIPARVRLLPIANRGRTYPVPTSHLGGALDSENVMEVAESALRYYEEFLNEAERFFVK